ncbi:RDD family protein [Allobranchiibius sp. CTAmp26]|uniref:RDD family protein n=1 Tax=Allobranchiibius sp. CTAmp26 TaxID=2815214 RepID=UPI001AA1859A|nr:RDD family protein [Allobranchiibius sp. CTAmp26]MBO1756203.1 RDD family protein [Allobranchiibius sp. CTAmp26]
MTQRPSGWYEDPDDPDQLRYWDGILWSPRRMPKVKPGLERSGPVPVAAGRPDDGPHRGGTLRPTPRPQADPWRKEPPHQQAPTTPDGDVLAGWWRRGGAVIIDFVLTSLVSALVAFPWTLDRARQTSDYFHTLTTWRGSGPSPQVPYNLAHPPWQIFVANIAVYALYEVGMTVWRGQTVGKIVTGIRVRRTASAGSPGLAAAVNRFLVKCVYVLVSFVPALSWIAAAFALVDYLWPLRDPARRALHDISAGTYVVRTRSRIPR